MSSIERKWLVLLGLALGTSACPQRTAIWIQPGSTSQNLVFRLSRKPNGREGLSHPIVRVDRCSAASDTTYPPPVWGAYVISDTLVHWMRYGDLSPEIEQIATPTPAPKALPPGCYHGTTNGTGSVTFQVNPDGTVTQTETFY